MTLALVLPNPLTLVTVAALLAAFGLGQTRMQWVAGTELAFAVFLGGVSLWLVLARVLTSLRDRIGADAAARVNQFVCFFALGLGIVYVASAAWTIRW